jgi:chromosome segregation protein
VSPSPLYQAAVAELEGVLSPRVVSRSLKEGMTQLGRTPEAVELDDIERILKAQIYRQLQVAMPLGQAKEKITEIIERLRSVETGAAPRDPTPAPLEGQSAALEELKASMKPFNLYFEWPEVQKLRAQIQLLDSELSAGKEAGGLLRDAREQLRAIGQKLEDSLVLQARDLGELADLLEQVRGLGGTKVRRLENLLGQIREAQDQRQLAPAEIERARKLGTDLRKLLESSVLAQKPQPSQEDVGILEVDPDEDDQLALVRDLDESVNAKLLQIDLESERFELGSIESSNAHLLEHRPEVRGQFESLRRKLDAGEPVASDLDPLRAALERATRELRAALAEELSGIADDAVRLRQHTDTAELGQAVQVARGVLEKSVPDPSDIRHIRGLHELARQRASEAEKRSAEAEEERQTRLGEQAAVIARLDATLREASSGAGAEFEALKGELAALRAAQDQGEHVPDLLAAVRRSEERYLAAVGGSGKGDSDGPKAQARALLTELESLPLLPAMRERAQSLAGKLSAALGGDGPGSSSEAAKRVAEGDVLLAALRLELRDAHAARLSAGRTEASELGRDDLVEAFEQAEARLAAGEFPSLHDLEVGLRSASDRRRQEELTEIKVLETEAARFAGAGLPGYEELCGLIEKSKEVPFGNGSAALLGTAWLQLESLRATVEQRLEGLERRLDAALAVLARVEKLNSEDVEEARRILRHLHDQRDSLGRVSLGLRLKLESSLQHAESLLAKLQQEYEATRAIADQLVSGNFIDDMLGLLGGDEPKPEDENAGVALPAFDETRKAHEARSENPKLNAWVDGYLAEKGMASLALLDRQGRLVAGRLQATPAEAWAALDRLMTELDALGLELGRGAPQLATLELGSSAVIASRPIGKYRLLAVLDAPSALSRVLDRLRRELARDPNKSTTGGTPLA